MEDINLQMWKINNKLSKQTNKQIKKACLVELKVTKKKLLSMVTDRDMWRAQLF